MTALNSSNFILSCFLEKDTLTPQDVITSKSLIDERGKEFIEAALINSFEEMVKFGFCSKVTYKEKDAHPTSKDITVYILNKPVDSIDQTLKIPYDLSLLLAEEVNVFRSLANNRESPGGDACKAGDINIEDISTIVIALRMLNKELISVVNKSSQNKE